MKLSELLCADTPVMVQGATGHAARRHMALMRRHGTNIVAGVSPGRSGERVDEIDIFSTCAAARTASAAVIAIQFVPARQVAEAAREALESGIKLLVTVTEGVPVHDSARVMRFARERGAIWIGPSTPGITIPGVIKLGFMPDVSLSPGPIGVMSKSGTLAYEVCYRLVRAGLGQSTWIGVGGDPVKGTRFSELLDYFGADPAPNQLWRSARLAAWKRRNSPKRSKTNGSASLATAWSRAPAHLQERHWGMPARWCTAITAVLMPRSMHSTRLV